MNKMILWAAFAVFLVACAPADAPDVDDMAADMGGDADMGPIDCYALDAKACRDNAGEFGLCAEYGLHYWNPQLTCFEPLFSGETRILCVPADNVWDSYNTAIVAPDGVCWGTHTALSEPPPGWTLVLDSNNDTTSCSCVKGGAYVNECNNPWSFCDQ